MLVSVLLPGELRKGGGKRALLGGLLAMFLLVGVVGWPDCSPAVDGTLKWAYTTGNQLSSSPAIAPNGTIYVGSRDNKLYAINPNGTLKWAYTTGGWVYSPRPSGRMGRFMWAPPITSSMRSTPAAPRSGPTRRRVL